MHTTILRSIPSALLALIVFFSSAVLAQEAIKIENFSPQGSVASVRQVRVQFSSAAAPFGDLAGAPDPLTPLCSGDEAPAGAGRWIDQSNWVYEFQADLPEGVNCSFSITSAFRTAHPKFSGTSDFKFSTNPAKAGDRPDPCKPGGPLLTMRVPTGYEGESEDYDGYNRPEDILENQQFILQTNCALDPQSISKGLWFEVDGVKDRVGIQVIDGPQREKILASSGAAGRENVIVVKPKLNFPAAADVSLVMGPGIRSASGFAAGEEQRVHYSVRPPFEVSTRCAHTYSDGSCDPYLPIYAVFTNSVPDWAEGEYQFPGQVKLQGKDGRFWYGTRSAFRENDRDYTAVQFAAPFPARQELTLAISEQFQDNAGRRLKNRAQLPLKVKVGKIPPMVRFGAAFGIIESKTGSGLPVTLRNIDAELSVNSGSNVDLINNVGDLNATVASTSNPAEVLKWLVAVQNRYENIETNESTVFSTPGLPVAVDTFTVKKPNGPEAFEVVGIPFKKPGFYVVEVASPSMGADLRGSGKTLYVPTSVLVTDMAVHFKLGRESSLAWVTSLETGEVVEGAEVVVRDCNGQELARALSDRNGIARIGALPPGIENSRCNFDQKYASAPGVKTAPVYDNSLVISAKKGDDFTFVLSNWTEGIENWRFGMPQEYYGYGASISHTVFDRTLFRRGETVHMKHLIRTKSTRGFDLVDSKSLPTTMEIRHIGAGDTFNLNLTWKDNGTAENEWKIPADAKLGEYNVNFKRPDGSTDYRYSGAFSVLEYRVPLMRAVIVPPKDEVITPPQVPIDVSVHYLAGGGASNLPVKVRYQVQPASYSFGGAFEDYVFASEIPLTTDRYQGEYSEQEEGGYESSPRPRTDEIKTVAAALDASGSARIVLDGVPTVTRPSKLFTELEYKDPNGEIQTVSSTVPLLPNPYLVGIKTDSWAQSRSKFKFSVAVVSSRGEPVTGVPVTVQLAQREVYTHRKRVIGGTFIYENIAEDTDRGGVCSGITGPNGLVSCSMDLPLSGNFILEARAKDPSGRVSSTASSIFVGDDDYWFAQENTDRMDLLPERKEYEPGETARFQVRVPFKRSTALVTVEREGIIDAFVTPLTRSSPVVEIPVRGSYGPNVFVSVMAVRGRISEAMPTALFDPGKPAFRLGFAQIRVGWKEYTLKVGMKADQEVYKVREKVPVKISVRTADGAAPPPGTEVAVAAVDEGLLELKPNESWKLLEQMMAQRPLAVQTMTAQMFLIGKRHFGLKALPFGGGGGKGSTRELFDTLLYWNPAVQLDATGDASITVPLNDSITSFKIVGVAIGRSGVFGTGSTSVRSTKDFILFAGLPPLVRNGDVFTAEVTARNTTATASEVSVDLQMAGDGTEHPPVQNVLLGAGESKVVTWTIHAPKEGEHLTYTASVSKGGAVEDSLKVSQTVRPAVPVQVQQATLMQLKSPEKIPVEIPSRALEGKGGVRVTFASSLGEDIEALRDYMRRYPFSCLEQRTSKAVSLGDAEAWQTIARDLPTYLDSDGFAKYFPSTDRGSEVLTSYVLAIAHEAGFEVPDAPKGRMIEALKRFVQGKVRTEQFRFLDQFYSEIGFKSKSNLTYAEIDLLGRKISALDALSRYGEADLALVSGLWPDPNNLPTADVVNLLSIAARSPELSERGKRMKELEQVLRSRLDLAGTTMRFAGERNEGFFWSMVSADVTAIHFVSTVLSNDDLFKKFSKDMGRLVRGMLDRQEHGKWDLTVANAWGALALQRQKERLSPIPVAGTSIADLGGKKFEFPWPQGDLAGKVEGVSLLPWPSGPSALSLAHQGTGAPWVTVQSLAAVPRTAPVSAGYAVSKRIEAVSQKVAGEYHVGDVVRVTVPFTSQSNKTWVVVNDPVPGGVTILGSGLDRDSALLTQGSSSADTYSWVVPAFEERTFESFRAYFREVPKGDFSVQYVMRFNTAGEFELPATRVEAMYAPEMFGELPNQKVKVLP